MLILQAVLLLALLCTATLAYAETRRRRREALRWLALSFAVAILLYLVTVHRS